MGKKSIRIGGDAKNAVNVAGDHNVVHAQQQLTEVALPPPGSVDIEAVIGAIREQLAGLALDLDDHARMAEAIEQAGEAAKVEQPDKSAIGSSMEKALEIAKTANNFAEICKSIGPHVVNAASWLGENWYKLLPIVGLTAG